MIKRIVITCEYHYEEELELFEQQLKRFLNNNMAIVDTFTDDI